MKNIEHSNRIVDNLRKLLGMDVVLLPIPSERKGPTLEGWQNITIEKMDDPQYLVSLNHGGNIGVLLGKNSDGLCTIDLDCDDDVEPFLKLNPKLRDTLRTRRGRGCNVWVRIKGNYPDLVKIKGTDDVDRGEWRASGGQTIIHGTAKDKEPPHKMRPYVFQKKVAPIEIAFDDIVWPSDWILPWKQTTEPPAANVDAAMEDLRRLYGEPFYQDKNGNILSIGEPFWAGLYAKENVLLFEPDEKQFYHYNEATGLYEVESADAVKIQISARMLEVSRQNNAFSLETKRKATTLNNILSHLRGITEKRGAFATKQKIVHLANGVMVFRDGEADLMPFDKSFFSRNRSPISFDECAKCERFLNELVLPAVHEDDAVLLQKYIGICLLGENIVQRILILDGEAGRGKTQLANVIQYLIGLLNCTQLRTEFLGQKFENFRFLKKTLLVGVDVRPDFLSTKGASDLKGLVGGDMFDAEQKGGTGSFQFQGKFCVVITSNVRLQVHLQGDIGAWKRRLLIVRYEAPPPKKKIDDFGVILVREEGSGILNWGLQGLGMVLADVREHGDIQLTPRQTGVVDSLLAESESLRHFLIECVEVGEDCDLSVDEIVEDYAQFCPEKSWSALPLTEVHKQLSGLMLELFKVSQNHCTKRDGRSVRGFSHVRFKI